MTATARKLVGGALVALLLASACGDDGEEASGETTSSSAEAQDTSPVFAGRLEGTDAYVAVGSGEGERAGAYVCDGKDLVAYLSGSRSGDTVTAEEPGGVSLTATIAGDEASGEVTLADGTAHAFTASLATGDAGYFRVDEEQGGGATSVGGWIRLEDGSVRGKKTTVAVESTDPGEVETTDEPDGGSAVPPAAEPAKFGGALKCGLAGFRFRRANERWVLSGRPEEGPIADALEQAGAELQGACG